MRPMLATDADLNILTFPKLAQPKIDGVRGLNIDNTLVGRSLKQFANRHITNWYSYLALDGFDGELFAGSETDSDLCRKTTSALTTIEGQPVVKWKIFDLHTKHNLPYIDRWEEAYNRVVWLNYNTSFAGHLEIMPYKWIHSMEELEVVEAEYIEAGYEGLILRNPFDSYKFGRSTKKEQGLLRIKRYADDEAIVVGLIESETNLNEAKKNELGYTERSTHQANKVLNGKIGSLICRDIKTGAEILVSAGKLNDYERKYYFENQNKIIGKLITYKYFPHGQKDKPRHPTFKHFRTEMDL